MNFNLFDETAAAEYLGGNAPVSTRTLQRWRAEGSGPIFVKIGRLVRYRKPDLDNFLAKHAVGSTAEANHAAA